MKRDYENIDLLDEHLLIEKCIEDNRLYQEAFYKKFAPKMYAICKNYADSRDEAMDFLQDGFVSVFNNLHKYRFEGSLEGWIRRVIVFRTIEALRKKKRYNEVLLEVDAVEMIQPEEFEIEDTSTPVDKIRELVNTLPEKAGLILKLYAIEGFSHAEIAEITGVSVGTSKSQLNRARKLIKEGLIQRNG
jgi:RNA polymerase sigma-70 factor (ECF subfamily)